jgi:hypothetical protein
VTSDLGPIDPPQRLRAWREVSSGRVVIASPCAGREFVGLHLNTYWPEAAFQICATIRTLSFARQLHASRVPTPARSTHLPGVSTPLDPPFDTIRLGSERDRPTSKAGAASKTPADVSFSNRDLLSQPIQPALPWSVDRKMGARSF